MTMKTSKPIIQGVASFVLAVASSICMVLLIIQLCSCSETPQQTTEVSVIWDVTEAHLPKPQADEILPRFALESNASNGAIFRFTYASDVSFNHETVFILPAGGNAFTTNQFDRKREIEKFRQQVKAFLDSLTTDTLGRPHSSLYVPIAKSLNRLAKESKAQHKILLVYSDLRENSSVMNFYKPQTLALLQNDSAKAQAMFVSQEPLDDLTGIELHLLYEPVDAPDDAAYRVISGFYKSLFESKDASVIVSANLPSADAGNTR